MATAPSKSDYEKLPKFLRDYISLNPESVEYRYDLKLDEDETKNVTIYFKNGQIVMISALIYCIGDGIYGKRSWTYTYKNGHPDMEKIYLDFTNQNPKVKPVNFGIDPNLKKIS